MIAHLRKDDELYVWRLDRLGRALKHIIDLVLSLNEKGVIIKGIADSVDTSTSSGRLFLNIMASLSEYERELIRERNKCRTAIRKSKRKDWRKTKRIYKRKNF